MYRYILIFIIYFILVFFYIYTDYNTRYNIYKDGLQQSFISSFNGAINSYELINDESYIEYESDLSKIISSANGATKEQRDAIRYKLRQKFSNLYNARKLSDLSVFHIFDRDGNSLLRFHNINAYDDHIIDKRESLKSMAKTMLAKHGFEIGIYKEAYRFQYPLFYDGEFVGSYEYGTDFKYIANQMNKVFGIKNILLLDIELIDNTVKKDFIKKRYKKVTTKNKAFYTSRSNISKRLEKRFKYLMQTKEMANNLTLNHTSFTSFSSNEGDFIAISSPVTDINGKKIGYILTGVEDKLSSMIVHNHIISFIFIILFGLILLIFIYKQIEYKKYVRNLIDTHHDILIVTDGKKIFDANRKLLEFFGFKSLKKFQNKYNCICDFFLKEDGYIQTDMNGYTWIKYIQANAKKHNRVIMLDLSGRKKYFEVTIDGSSGTNYMVIVFNDISENIRETKELEDKAYFDALTGIYVRERFTYYLNKRFSQKREFSLIMFDIDFFKKINDNYGHDVGDSVLIELTTIISHHIRDDDIFARWGGEEFMIIVNSNIVNAERFANKLRTIIELHKFKHVKHLACSFGVAKYRETDTTDTLTKRVDTMLYSAKDSGRNCVVAVN